MTATHRSPQRRPQAALRLAAALCCLAVAVPAARAERREDLAARLDQGEIVVHTRTVRGSEVPRVTVIGVVAAPPEEVWAIVSSCTRLQEVLEAGSVAEVLRSDGPKTRCQVRVAMPFPFDNLVSITDVRLRVGKGRWRSTWTMAGGNFVANDGSWTLAPHGDGTLVVYEVHAAPDLAIPKPLLVQTQRSRMTAMLERIREVLR